jgi:hypothetical protein
MEHDFTYEMQQLVNKGGVPLIGRDTLITITALMTPIHTN